MGVWFFLRFLGAFPYARSPLGARDPGRVIEIWKPLSSTDTSLPASKRGASHLKNPRASSSLPEATGDFF